MEKYEGQHRIIMDFYNLDEECAGIVWQIFRYFDSLYEDYNSEKFDNGELVKRGYFPTKEDSPHYNRRAGRIKKKYKKKRENIDTAIELIRSNVPAHSRAVIGDINLNKQTAIIAMLEDEKKTIGLSEDSELYKAQSFGAYIKEMNEHYRKILSRRCDISRTSRDNMLREIMKCCRPTSLKG